jgi:hypothetical protein
MSSHSLIWAAVPHNGDGVVYQVVVAHGHQRFHIPRRVLEEAFQLEPKASDARQLEIFYLSLERLLTRARIKRSIAGSDTVPLLAADFTLIEKELTHSNWPTAARTAL